MKTYSLHFKARGEQIVTPIICEVLQGKTSLSYKPIVDEEISNWLKKKMLNASSSSILDIVLENDSKQIIFAQENWIVPSSIMIKEFDEHSNSDLIN
jgi:hypothetical protein